MGVKSDGSIQLLLWWFTVWASLAGRLCSAHGAAIGTCLVTGRLEKDKVSEQQRRTRRCQLAREQNRARREFEAQGELGQIPKEEKTYLPIRWGRGAFQVAFPLTLEMRWEDKWAPEFAAWTRALEEIKVWQRTRQWETRWDMLRGLALLLFALAVSASVGALLGTIVPLLTAFPLLKDFDSTLGYPGEGPAGDRTETWDASVQTATRRIACCRCCSLPFEANQVRVSLHGCVTGKYFHPHCIAAGLGPVRGVHGYTELSPEARAVIDQFVDRPGATREEYLETKRRRLVPTPPNIGENPSELDKTPSMSMECSRTAFCTTWNGGTRWTTPGPGKIGHPLLEACRRHF